MEGASTSVAARLVFYAGRFMDRIQSVDLPEGCTLLGDWDVLPAQLTIATQEATSLVVLDLFSFPFEALSGVQRDIPLIVVLPSGLDEEFLTTVFGEAVFARLDFFDRIATPDRALWKSLRRRYCWAEQQRIELESCDPDEAAKAIGSLLEAESCRPLPHPDFDKATHRVQKAALAP